MDATLHALGGILLRGVPTFLLVVFLTFYLKVIFFKPMGRVLEQRYQSTEGAKLAAQKAMEHAGTRIAEYEAAMRAARGEVYQVQEQLHKKLEERHAADLAASRRRADEGVKQAKAQLAEDVESAQAGLAAESETLAAEIAESILRRTAA